MSIRARFAQAIAGATMISGPALASAEATGALDGVGHKLIMYVASGALTLIGLLVSGLFYFVKKEYSGITSGIANLRESVHRLTNSVQIMTLKIETTSTELRGDVARRISIEDHSRSASALHEKINRLDRTVSYVRAKLGMREGDDGSERG